MGDSELRRVVEQSLGLDGIVDSLLVCKLEYVCACAHSLEAVLCLVCLVLDTCEQGHSSEGVGEFVGNYEGSNVAEVSVGEGLITEGSVDMVLAISVDIVDHEVYEREVTAVNRTRLILM